MIILGLRTDKPEAKLYLYDDQKQLQELRWQANRQLAETIHHKIKEILDSAKHDFNDLNGILCFEGPGSFTGLRIGLSVANALAYAQNIPIVATGGKHWLKQGVNDLLSGKNQTITIPKYGELPKTSSPSRLD